LQAQALPSLAGAGIKLNIYGQDRYGLNSVLKDVSRQKGGEAAGAVEEQGEVTVMLS